MAFSLATPCCTLPKMQSQRFRERLVSDGVPAQACPSHCACVVGSSSDLPEGLSFHFTAVKETSG